MVTATEGTREQRNLALAMIVFRGLQNGWACNVGLNRVSIVGPEMGRETESVVFRFDPLWRDYRQSMIDGVMVGSLVADHESYDSPSVRLELTQTFLFNEYDEQDDGEGEGDAATVS